MLDLLHLDHLSLLQNLDSVEALVVFRLDQMHSSKRARSKGPLDVEVGQCVFAFRLSGGTFTIHHAGRGRRDKVGDVHVVGAVACRLFGGGVGGRGHGRGGACSRLSGCIGGGL